MTAVLAPAPSPAPRPAATLSDRLGSPFVRGALGAVVVMLLLTTCGRVADANDLTSVLSFSAVIRQTVPILLAGMAALYSERVGVVNIGVEGMMVVGTFFAGWVGWEYGPWWGFIAGILGGAGMGLVHAVATVTFGVDHTVSGVAINLLGPGIARFLASLTFDASNGGSSSLGPSISGNVGRFTVPFVAGGELFGWKSPDIAGWFVRRDWFFVSDVAALIKGVTVSLSWLSVLALLLVPATAWLMWRTAFGLRLRSVGERPTAADSLGIPVYRMKYIGVMISGGMAGAAGAVLVLDAAGRFSEGQTVGTGFLGIAAMIVGNWRPWGVLGGALLFGFPQAMRLRSPESVLALVLLITIVAAVIAAVLLLRRKVGGGATVVVLAAFFAWVYWGLGEVPDRLTGTAPYLVTLLVLAFASQRLRPPAADGLIWRKGQVT